jgi:hypothetical protein
MDMIRDGIVRAVRLRVTLITHEDHLMATFLQLLRVQHHVPDVYDTPKCHKVVHRWLISMLRHEWGHLIHTLHRAHVQHIYNGTHRFTLEPSKKAVSLEHARGGCHHCAISVLDDDVLLRVVWRCVLTMHTLNRVVLRKLP